MFLAFAKTLVVEKVGCVSILAQIKYYNADATV